MRSLTASARGDRQMQPQPRNLKKNRDAYCEHLIAALVARDGGDPAELNWRMRQIRSVEREGLLAAGAVPFKSVKPGGLFIRAYGSLFLKRDTERVSAYQGDGEFKAHTYVYIATSEQPVLMVENIEAAEEILGKLDGE